MRKMSPQTPHLVGSFKLAGSARPENELKLFWGGGESGSQRRRKKKKKHKRPMESEMRKKRRRRAAAWIPSAFFFPDDKDVNIFSGNLFAQFLFFLPPPPPLKSAKKEFPLRNSVSLFVAAGGADAAEAMWVPFLGSLHLLLRYVSRFPPFSFVVASPW